MNGRRDGRPGIGDHQVDRAVQGDRLLNGGLHSCKVGHVGYSPAMGIPLKTVCWSTV